MIDFSEKYNREEVLEFLQGDFLRDFQKDIRKVGVSGDKFIKDAFSLGSSRDFGLAIFEFEHTGSTEKRVSLTKEAFQILKESGFYRALAFFHSKDTDDWRFSFMTITPTLTEKGKIKKEFSNPKRFSFLLGPRAKVNTPTQFLIKKGPIESLDDLKERFSIEVVNKEFYTKISELFVELVGGELGTGRNKTKYEGLLKLPGVEPKSKGAQEFAVRLIGRLIFCWFLREKKNGTEDSLMPDSLLSYEAAKSQTDYYHEVLEPIFFKVLNVPIGSRKEEKYSKDPYGQIPYLNGGLFTPHDDDYYSNIDSKEKEYRKVVLVPDKWIQKLFKILETYNFTIDENSSFDEELSIDPEMLGRIFENLLAEINPETGESARKSTGSFYTPRVIVDYMVDESLYLYLGSKTNIEEKKLRALISYDLDDDIDSSLSSKEKEDIVNAIDELKILDPACGSGAFPIGLLQKIVFILQQLDPNGQFWFKKQIENVPVELRKNLEREHSEKNFDYIRKLGVIRKNIFGVDIQPIATEISRLRCFLTLIVDQKVDDNKENRGIDPLPNLDFKFVTANSLVSLPNIEKKDKKVGGIGMFEGADKINELKDIRDQFFNATNYERIELKDQFREIQLEMSRYYNSVKSAGADLTEKLLSWDPFSHKSTDWFDPEWMFGIKEGFDLVIANPPYISYYSRQSQQLDPNIESNLRQYSFLSGKSKNLRINTIMFFLENGYNFLRINGTLTYIMDLNVLENPFKSIRNFISKKMDINEVTHGLTAFEGIGSGQIILFAQKKKTERNLVSMKKDIYGTRESVLQQEMCVGEDYFWIINKNLNLCNRIALETILLENKVIIHTGVAVNATPSGKNYFIRNTEKDGCYPLLLGSQSVPFRFSRCSFKKWLLYDKVAEKKLNEEYDKAYFEKKGSHQRPFNIRKLEEYNRPKIILRQSDVKLTATFCEELYFGNYSLFNIYRGDNNIIELKYILALINSNLMTFYALSREIILVKPGKTPQIRSGQRGPIGIRQLPIKDCSLNEKESIVRIVDDILSITNRDDYEGNKEQIGRVNSLTIEINNKINKIYNLTEEEIKIIDKYLVAKRTL